MSQGPLCPNLTQKFQKEVSQIANRNLSHVMLLGGLSINLNHLKMEPIGKLQISVKIVYNVTPLVLTNGDVSSMLSVGYNIFQFSLRKVSNIGESQTPESSCTHID